MRDSRRLIDSNDAASCYQFLKNHDPFAPSNTLHVLSTGIVGDGKINCHRAKEIGQRGVKSMEGKSFADVTISRSFKVNPLSIMKGVVIIRDEIIPVNSTQLFMRILCFMKDNPDFENYFR